MHDRTGYPILFAFIGLLVVGALASSLYWYVNKDSSLQDQKAALAAKLEELQIKANAEAKKLRNLSASYRSQKTLNASIADQFSSFVDLFHQTDTFFISPNSDEATLRLKSDSKTSADLNKRRQELNALLKSLGLTVNSFQDSDIPNLELIIQTNKVAESLQAFFSALKPVAENSGYLYNLQTRFDTVVENINRIETAANVSNNNGQVHIPIITLEDIQRQQNVVNQVEAEIIHINEQNNASSTPPYQPYVIPFYNFYYQYTNPQGFQGISFPGPYYKVIYEPKDPNVPDLVEGTNKL